MAAVYWHFGKHLTRQGWTNALRLSKGAGIGYPAADRIFKHLEGNVPLTRFDFATLHKIAAKLGVPSKTLLRWEP